jgi:hypothetical protein
MQGKLLDTGTLNDVLTNLPNTFPHNLLKHAIVMIAVRKNIGKYDSDR